jgi:CMP-N-acetylneuraminic acid synthetase
MIPARMGSTRLERKNLRELAGIPLMTRAIRKCAAAAVFDEIWVNSEHPAFGDIARAEGAGFHQRPDHLGDDCSTSEQYVAEFLEAHPCDLLFQVHGIAPLLTADDIRRFVSHMKAADCDCLLSTEEIQIECAFRGQPVNFTFAAKSNSQELEPLQRIAWSITGWRRTTYLAAVRTGGCATYAGAVELFPIGRLAAHVIKVESDLAIAEALLPLVEQGILR